MIPQSETERLLEAQLDALGVQVERTVELETFSDVGHEVVATLRHADGRSEVMRTPYLFGCDGTHSVVRNGLGLAFDGSTMPSDWMLGDLHIDGPLAEDELTMCWTKEGVLAVFPMGGNRFRIIADVGLATGDLKPPPTLGEIQAVLDARGPPGLRGRDPIWLSHFRINERKVRDYRRGRIFLVGDAAHIHSPAGGQGMNTGMQDAFNLAWKIALVCKGTARDALLDSYSVERSAIGDQVLRNAGRMTEVAMLRNPLLRELRNIVASTLMGHVAAVRQRMVDALTEVDLHYAESPLTRAPSGASSYPRGGDRATDVPLVTSDANATDLHALLASGKFVVLSVGAPRVILPEALCVACDVRSRRRRCGLRFGTRVSHPARRLRFAQHRRRGQRRNDRDARRTQRFMVNRDSAVVRHVERIMGRGIGFFSTNLAARRQVSATPCRRQCPGFPRSRE